MKTLFIGDIHGRTIWNDIINHEKPDKVIFVGDYFDSFDITGNYQIENFNNIIDYKKNSNIDITLLFGNHDYHYLPTFQGYNRYSGYQAQFSFQIQECLVNNLEHFKMCYQIDDIVCSHAGISYYWIMKHLKDETLINDIPKLIETINDYFIFKPNVFNFDGLDFYGDDLYQTPIWIRPKSLMKSNESTLKDKIIQIVGHTDMEYHDIKNANTNGRYYFIDGLEYKKYLVYDNNQFTFKQL
jgi:hypothetical protein